MNVRKGRLALIAGAAAALAFTTAVPANAATVSDPILDDLAGPLSIAVGNDGSLYAAQVFSGTLTELRKGKESNLFEFAGGVAAVEAEGRGTLSYVLDGEVTVRNPSGKTRALGNVSEYEAANNPDAGNSYGLQGLAPACAAEITATLPPDFAEALLPHGGVVDSNPYALAILPSGDRVVADAGGNSLVRVTPSGKVSTLAVLPPRPVVISPEAAGAFGLPDCTVGLTMNLDFVPTDVEVGPEGMLYVTSLPGGPEGESPLGPLGGVFTVNPGTGSVSQIGSGFFGATDLAVADNGDVYVTELYINTVSMLSGGGPVPVASIPEAVAVEYAKGKLYVAGGVFGGPGEVVTVTP